MNSSMAQLTGAGISYYIPMDIMSGVVEEYYGGINPNFGQSDFLDGLGFTNLNEVKDLSGVYQVQCGNINTEKFLFIHELEVDFQAPTKKEITVTVVDPIFTDWAMSLDSAVKSGEYIKIFQTLQTLYGLGYDKDNFSRDLPNNAVARLTMDLNRNKGSYYNHIESGHNRFWKSSFFNLVGGEFFSVTSMPLSYSIYMKTFKYRNRTNLSRLDKGFTSSVNDEYYTLRKTIDDIPVLQIQSAGGDYRMNCVTQKTIYQGYLDIPGFKESLQRHIGVSRTPL